MKKGFISHIRYLKLHYNYSIIIIIDFIKYIILQFQNKYK